MFDNILRLFSKKNIALFVDGPNVIRKGVNVDLKEVKEAISKYGFIKLARVYLDQFAPEKLIEAMVNQGFEPVITTGDVDTSMAVDATEWATKKDVEYIALMTRDTDFIPVILKAKQYGKKVIVIGTDIAFSAALKNNADVLILMEKKENKER